MNKIISEFLSYLNISISQTHCERLLASHPDYPSLLSIVDVFERLAIPHVVGKIEKEKIDDLSFPYILQLGKKHGEIIIIRSKSDLQERNDDLQHWSGVVVQVVPPESITDKENNQAFKREKFIKQVQYILLAAASTLFVFALTYNFSALHAVSLVIALMGIVVGYLLVAKELGIKYKAVENFCKTGKNSDCDKILDSEDAKLFGEVKLSDAVLAYFVFQVLFLTLCAALPSLKASILLPLSVLSFLLIPVVIYSIYYQYAKAKSWCKLCLVVDGILIVQSYILGYLNFSFSLNELRYEVALAQALLFILIGCAVLLFKNKIETANHLAKLIPPAARVKNNPRVFAHLLKQQRQINGTLMDREVLIGNRDAPVKIIMVSNLFCKPCKEQHDILEQLIKAFPGKVNVALRFVVSKSEKANHYLIEYWLRFIHAKDEESMNTLRLLHEWYSMMDLERFKEKYPMEDANGFYGGEEIEKRHSKWIERVQILYTPTLFVNGYELPKAYELADIISLLPSLAEEPSLKIIEQPDFEVYASELQKV